MKDLSVRAQVSAVEVSSNDDEKDQMPEEAPPVKISKLVLKDECRSASLKTIFRANDELEARFVEDDHKQVFNGDGQLIAKNSTYLAEAIKLFERLLQMCRYEVVDIDVSLYLTEYPYARSEIQYLPKLKRATIRAETDEELRFWLRKMPDHLEHVTFTRRTPPTLPDIFSMPQLVNADSLVCDATVHLTEAQLLGLQASRCYFANTPHTTYREVNAFMKQWQFGQGAVRFARLALNGVEPGDEEVLIEGLDSRPEPLDGLVREENEYTRAVPSKVRPHERLRLIVNYQSVIIAVTYND